MKTIPIYEEGDFALGDRYFVLFIFYFNLNHDPHKI